MPDTITQNTAQSLPEGTRIYAVGDIHGMLRPLQALHVLIEEEEKKRGAAKTVRVIYLGDYIDRGRDSKQVVEYLIARQKGKMECVFLKGNHENAMLKFMVEPELYAAWLKWGGIETIASYGINPFTALSNANALSQLAVDLNAAIGPEHKKFYENLKLLHEEGDYLFVHAGLRPGLPLAQQTEHDLLTIREGFIDSNYAFDKKIVFGHTIFKTPYQKYGKIGVDTGAYMSGKLTCAVLEKNDVRFLTT